MTKRENHILEAGIFLGCSYSLSLVGVLIIITVLSNLEAPVLEHLMPVGILMIGTLTLAAVHGYRAMELKHEEEEEEDQ